MSDLQHWLSEYLQTELYHSLGAYHVAERRQRRLIERLGDSSEEQPDLLKVVKMAADYNRELSRQRYASVPSPREENGRRDSKPLWLSRDPVPGELPLTNEIRFTIGQRDNAVNNSRRSPWRKDTVWHQVPRFYSEAVAALEGYDREVNPAPGSDDYNRHNFARSLVAPRDGAPRPKRNRTADERLARRLERYRFRREEAHSHVGPRLEPRGALGSIREKFGAVAAEPGLAELYPPKTPSSPRSSPITSGPEKAPSPSS